MNLQIRESIINYEVKGEGRPIIFFSGFENDMTAMIKCMEPIFELKDNWKRIYVDHLGVGKTVIGDEVESVTELLDTMNEFVDQLMGDQSFVLGGYSFGGYLSRYILKNKKDKIEGLFLLTPLVVKELEHCDVDRSIEVVKHMDKSVQDQISTMIQKDLVGAMQSTNQDFMYKLYMNNLKSKVILDDFEGTYDKPTLIITGRQDDTVGYKDAFKLLEKYPRATYISMDMCGHASQIEQNGLFTHLTLEWINRLDIELNR
jgi:pimeloyl-ACP methyl ester carboxylesterase